ncbi:MAG: hypothetical protein K0B15_13455 [Lentimicrobium sp.]|nr:hypothetical protein [Lentimicrobium sp.]
MMNSENLNIDGLENVVKRLESIEERIALLESSNAQIRHALSPSRKVAGEDDSEFIDLKLSISAPFETKIGEYGLAWLGNIVLFFAIIFLWQYFNDAGKPLISAIVGALSVIGVFVMSFSFRKNFSYLSSIFNLFGYIILFYIILRLHYFTQNPFLNNQVLATFLLLIMCGVQLYFAIRNQSQILAGLAFIFLLITAFVSNQTHGFFLIVIATNGLVLYTFWKYNWWKAMIIILCLSFLTFLVWILKNPVSLIKTPGDLTYHYAFIYFSVTTAFYSLLALRKPNGGFPENVILSTILLAGNAYSILLLTLVIMHFPGSFVPFFIAISIFCITYSVILKIYSPWKYSPALFALFGFVSISLSVFGIYHFPDSFLLLICQSFLVLAIALWYRSQIITLMNTFLLLALILLYYKISGNLQAVNFSIPVVAFLSARIINWQKERLNIKTDFIRNIYLFILFFSALYATYHGLPKQYITVSWLCLAGIYFGLSILVKSIKYRWMAMANILVAAFYLFLIDLANIELVYRILIFLAFAITTIIISTYYVKKLKYNGNDKSTDDATDGIENKGQI